MRDVIIKTCKTCTKEFNTRYSNAVYCSKECNPFGKYERIKKHKICVACGSSFISTRNKTKYCSLSCATKSSFENRKSKLHALKLKKCECCGTEVEMFVNQRFCSTNCKSTFRYRNSIVTTETQYKLISGNWEKYLLRLLYQHNRKADGLTRDDLLNVLKTQNYKCALSGTPLTCDLKVGTISKTNASIDRINAGEKYTKDNIQLVCRAVNSWRSNLSISEFVNWCKKVVDYNENNSRR